MTNPDWHTDAFLRADPPWVMQEMIAAPPPPGGQDHWPRRRDHWPRAKTRPAGVSCPRPVNSDPYRQSEWFQQSSVNQA